MSNTKYKGSYATPTENCRGAAYKNFDHGSVYKENIKLKSFNHLVVDFYLGIQFYV